MQEIRGRVVVVTGGASGIGRALVERFYVLPHPEVTEARVRDRMEGILHNRTPASPPLPRS